jgi:sugar phosphate isomerase/epimerase
VTPPKLGIASHSVPDVEKLTPLQVLKSVTALGLDGCVFMNPLQISPTLDPAALQDMRACADDLGLYLEIGLGRISPYHFAARDEVLAVGDGDFRQGLTRMIEALRAVGCTDLFFWIGSPADRVSRAVPWTEQVRATRQFLVSLAPLLRDLGMRLALKTHGEDHTSRDVETVEMVGADVLAIAFDPSDVCASLEDPLAAARRVGPYVRVLQADDMVLSFTDRGLVRQARPCGDGVIDWSALLTILRDAVPADLPTFRVNVELHRVQPSMPIFDRAWLAHHADLPVGELAEAIRLARLSERRLATGEICPMAAYPDREARLAPSMAFLRRALAEAYAAP